MNTVVNRSTFTFFSSADWRDAMKEWNEFVDNIKTNDKRQKSADTEIVAYFDDIDDEYRVCIVDTNGNIIFKNVYSWDEVSQIIHDNL